VLAKTIVKVVVVIISKLVSLYTKNCLKCKTGKKTEKSILQKAIKNPHLFSIN